MTKTTKNPWRRIVTISVLIAQVLTLGWLTGCDPYYRNEFHAAQVPDVKSTVVLEITRWGGVPEGKKVDYDFPPTIRFCDSNGMIWELHLIDKDPSSWKLYLADRDRQAREVPLRLLGWSGTGDHPEYWPALKYPEQPK